MASDHILYLTNSGSLNFYPENKSGHFINRLPTPIILDNNTEYEVGLISILYPDQYYAILANDSNFNIIITTYQKTIPKTIYEIEIKNNILAGDMDKLVSFINDQLFQYLEPYFSREIFPHIIPESKKIFVWNNIENRVEIHTKIGDPSLNITKDIITISLTMKQGLSQIFGFYSNVGYTIYSNKDAVLNIHKSSIPPSPRCGVDYIYLYTDIIQPSYFGGQLVNILDCFTLQNGGNKSINNSIYKPLNTTFIDQISIIIKDQKGRSIHFIEDSTLMCVIHIRPK